MDSDVARRNRNESAEEIRIRYLEFGNPKPQDLFRSQQAPRHL